MKDRISKGRPAGFHMSEESKLKMSNTKLGKTQTEETKAKIAESLRKYHESQLKPVREYCLKCTVADEKKVRALLKQLDIPHKCKRTVVVE